MSDILDRSPAVRIELRLPDILSFKRLRQDTHWGVPEDAHIDLALKNSLFGAVAISKSQTVGMIRIVGDGALNLYTQDVIVAHAFRGQGIGRSLVQSAIHWMQETIQPSATIGLMAADGQAAFYEAFGFTVRPSTGVGPGMHAQLSNLRNR